MTSLTDLLASIQDHICTDVAMMIMAEEEHKAYVLRCIVLRRQPFIEGWLDPVDFYERPVTEGSAQPTSRATHTRSSPRKRAIIRSTASSRIWRQRLRPDNFTHSREFTHSHMSVNPCLLPRLLCSRTGVGLITVSGTLIDSPLDR